MARSRPFAVIGDADGIDCVLCDAWHETIEAHSRHMEASHGL